MQMRAGQRAQKCIRAVAKRLSVWWETVVVMRFSPWSLDPSLVQGAEMMLRQDQRMESDRQACRRRSRGGGARRLSRVGLDESLKPDPNAPPRREKVEAAAEHNTRTRTRTCCSCRTVGDRSEPRPTPMCNCQPFPIQACFPCHFFQRISFPFFFVLGNFVKNGASKFELSSCESSDEQEKARLGRSPSLFHMRCGVLVLRAALSCNRMHR